MSYVKGTEKAGAKINNPFFNVANELDDEVFEISSKKRKIKLDIPNQLGFFILTHAKLRMLQYYYDWLCVFADQSSFETVECDT